MTEENSPSNSVDSRNHAQKRDAQGQCVENYVPLTSAHLRVVNKTTITKVLSINMHESKIRAGGRYEIIAQVRCVAFILCHTVNAFTSQNTLV
jgi:hypothetical protein